MAGCLASTTSMSKSWVQGWPSKRAPSMVPYSGQRWLASVAEWTPRMRRCPSLPRRVDGFLLGGGPRRLPDGEEGEDADGGEAIGRDVADVGDDGGREAVHGRQLLQGGGGLAQHPVHAGRAIGVRGDLGDDQHLAGHDGECRVSLVAGAAPCSGGRMHGHADPAEDHDVTTERSTTRVPRTLRRSWRGSVRPPSVSRVAGRRTAGSGRPGPAPPWLPRPIPSAARRATTWRVHVAVTTAPRGASWWSTWAGWPTVATGARC